MFHTIPSSVVSRISNLLHKACTNILNPVTEFNALGNSNSILCNFRSTKALLNNNIYTLGPIVTLTASANSSTPLNIKARASTPNLMSLAA
ncbi:Os03g0143532 [Oryza sativa Japonica Group]|uniref:Os03g0143532 protein n=1 Tax=Oryza sativa subsp. japonica TaxID=39947 RepID=A0A0P0VST6_ORYSJ|nr:hypothetical protein EE612_015247 [Oryza sativa]BAS82243.1 Os03g0143532 [Oryza sativa Japonica Group]